jgi:hypothetical protein
MGPNIVVEDLIEDDALTHFHFKKINLQEGANNLWPRLQPNLSGYKCVINFQNGKFSIPYDTLLLLVLYRLHDSNTIVRTWNCSLVFCFAR